MGSEQLQKISTVRGVSVWFLDPTRSRIIHFHQVLLEGGHMQ